MAHKLCRVNTSVLVRTVDLRNANAAVAIRAIDRLVLRGFRMCIVPQSLYEFARFPELEVLDPAGV